MERLSRPIALGAALVAALAVAAFLWRGGGDDPSAPVAAPAAAPAPAGKSAAAGAGAEERGFQRLALPAKRFPLVWLRRDARVALRTAPGGGELVKRVGPRTEFGQVRAYSVVRTTGRWAAVPTPMLPNGELGWLKLDAQKLRAGWSSYSIEVDLSDRTLTLVRGTRELRSFAVTVGMPGAETPTGRFAVTDEIIGGLNPAYGCCAMALTARQPHLPSGWLGGNRIAIHGTSGPLGVAASHGCVRATDRDMRYLASRARLATPVFIRQ